MSADLHDLLDRGAAPRPTAVDGDALLQRGRRRRATKRAGAGVLAGVVLLGGGAVVTNAITGPDAPIVSEVPGNASPEWRQIPAAPIEGRARPTLAVDGDRVAVWGGDGTMRSVTLPDGSDLVTDVVLQDGAVVGLETGTWQTVGAPSITPRRTPAVRLSGESLLVWGGRALQPVAGGGVSGGDEPLMDGAVHDLTTGQWTPVAAPPLAPRASAIVDWDGQRLLVWGGDDAESGEPTSDGGVWTADTGWTVLADFPLAPRSGSAVGVDEDRIVVWGGGTDLQPEDGFELLTNDGAVYDRATDSWSVLPPVDLEPGWFSYGFNTPTALLEGDRFLVAGASSTAPLGYSLSGAWLDLATGTWTPITDAPADARYVLSTADGVVAVNDTAEDRSTWRVWAYDLAADRWRVAPYGQDASVITPWADLLNESASNGPDTDGAWRPVTTLRADGVTSRPTLTDVGESRDFVSLATTDSGVVLFGGLVRDPDGSRWFGHDGEHRADGWFLPNP